MLGLRKYGSENGSEWRMGPTREDARDPNGAEGSTGATLRKARSGRLPKELGYGSGSVPLWRPAFLGSFPEASDGEIAVTSTGRQHVLAVEKVWTQDPEL